MISKARILDIFYTKYWRFLGRICRNTCSVLMFHYVTGKPVDIDECCKCSTDNFRQILLRLKSEGYSFISTDEVYNFSLKPKHGKYVSITFDDVPCCVYTNAYPILKELEIPFTLFITVNYIDKADYITSDQLRVFITDPLCTIGAHTMTHPFLAESKNIFQELYQSKIELEKITGRTVEYLAYPYGKHNTVNREVRKIARKAGFKCAFGTIDAPISRFINNLFYLPRIVINK